MSSFLHTSVTSPIAIEDWQVEIRRQPVSTLPSLKEKED
jgi:hypothetical protein